MRQILVNQFGGPEVLELRDVETPTPGPGEVLVRVRASSVNMADVDYITGRTLANRFGTGLRQQFTLRTGNEALSPELDA